MKRIMIAHIILALLSVGAFVSCVGDGIMDIKGQVFKDGVASSEECVLSLYLAEKGREVSRRSVGPKIDIKLTVAPSPRNYYLQLLCPSGYGWMSEAFVFPQGDSYAPPIDLRRIEAKKGFKP